MIIPQNTPNTTSFTHPTPHTPEGVTRTSTTLIIIISSSSFPYSAAIQDTLYITSPMLFLP